MSFAPAIQLQTWKDIEYQDQFLRFTPISVKLYIWYMKKSNTSSMDYVTTNLELLTYNNDGLLLQ